MAPACGPAPHGERITRHGLLAPLTYSDAPALVKVTETESLAAEGSDGDGRTSNSAARGAGEAASPRRPGRVHAEDCDRADPRRSAQHREHATRRGGACRYFARDPHEAGVVRGDLELALALDDHQQRAVHGSALLLGRQKQPACTMVNGERLLTLNRRRDAPAPDDRFARAAVAASKAAVRAGADRWRLMDDGTRRATPTLALACTLEERRAQGSIPMVPGIGSKRARGLDSGQMETSKVITWEAQFLSSRSLMRGSNVLSRRRRVV
jgi:hypothetical protein